MAREMKDSGIDWVGEIPVEWGKEKVIRLFGVIGSGTTPKLGNNHTFDSDIYWIQSGDITGSYILSAKNKIPKYITNEYSALKIYKAPFLVIAMYGASIGNLALSNIDACVNQACCVLGEEHLDLAFGYYCFNAAHSYLVYNGIGGGQPNISQEVIKQLWFPLPCKGEQEEISKFLDAKCAEIDAVLEKTRSSIAEYKKLKQAIITKAATKGIREDRPIKESGIEWIDEIPANWEVYRGKRLFCETNERSETGSEELLTVSHITGITPRSQKNVNMFMSESLVGYKICRVGDIAANTMWMWQGAIGVSEYHGVISPSYNTYRQRNGAFDSRYLDYLLRIHPLINMYNACSTGITASRLRLYPEQFLSFKFPVPPMEEQQEIVRYLGDKVGEMNTLIQKKEQFLTELDTYKKSIIYEYVTGKKEVLE